MASDNAERRSLPQRLETVYWLLLTILLGLPLITPLLRWSSVPCTHDGHLHYHRVAAMAHAWDNGIYLTRWLPDLAFGYGYPFFVYREAAPLYAVLLPFLAGLPLPAASNLFYAVTILLCGVFMFLWARDLFGPRAGLVSAVAYMGAPYVLVDALIRGNSPESLALPLFPFLLWAGRRWVLFASWRYFLAGAAGLALLSVAHNISTFIFAPTLVVYLAALAVLNQTTNDRPETTDSGRRSAVGGRLFRAAALLGLGLGMAFFYTGGAVLEMDQVTLEMSTTTRNNDWRYNFASWGEILSPVAAEDPNLVNPPLLFRLGWMPLLLAAAGVTGLLWIKGGDARAREQRLHIWLMLAGAAVYLFMALPISRWLWEIVPLIDFVQFPWRFVGRAALPVAFLAGVPFYYFDRRSQSDADTKYEMRDTEDTRRAVGRWSTVILAIAIALLIIETIPNLYPRLCREEPFPTILTVHNYERVTGLVGVDPEGSYFPRTVGERPAGSPLEADFAAGRTPQRFDATALPPGAELRDVVYNRFGVTLTVDSPAPFTARYLSFAFPGWSARVDGERVDIIPESPSGLITFEVPAGTHAIEVNWGATPLRLALVGLSILSAAGVAAVVVATRRRPPATDHRRPALFSWPPGRNELVLLLLLGAGLLGLKVFVDRNETVLRRADAPPVAHATALQGGEMALNGYNLSRDRVPAGETFAIDLAWTAVAPPQVDYQSEIALIGPDRLAWNQKGTERTRVYEDAAPTRLWAAGEWGWDSREVQTLSGAPPGIYDIVVTLFDRATLAPVTLIDTASGQAAGPEAVIGQIEIVNPEAAPAFDAQFPLEHHLPGSSLRLLGFNQDRAEATPGEAVLMTLFWECEDAANCERFPLALRDADGAVAREWSLPAVREGLPPAAWPAHGRLRGQHLVPLPASLDDGRYQFSLGDFPLGEITIVAPERVLSEPELAQRVDAAFADAAGEAVATLAGIGLDAATPCLTDIAPGTICSLPLVWRAERETTTAYHVFVHLADEAGNILAQSDAVPAGWARPTTGWLPGEYIVDVHSLILPSELPSDQLAFRVGLYDPDTGQRLAINGSDAAFITLP